MKKITKISLILGICLTVVGLCLGVISAFALDFDFNALSTVELTSASHTVSQDFQNIRIKTDTADVRFVYTPEGTDPVVVLEEAETKHTVSVKNNTLHITETPHKNWWELIQVNFHSPSITVYLPESSYHTLSVETDTGDMEIKALTFHTLQLETDTGDMDLLDITVEADLKLETDTGDILLKGSSADSLSLEADTGDVTFERFGAQSIHVETDTGDVEGTLSGPMVFDVKSHTGDVDVPRSSAGGICKIRTDTGDVELQIQ